VPMLEPGICLELSALEQVEFGTGLLLDWTRRISPVSVPFAPTLQNLNQLTELILKVNIAVVGVIPS